MTSGPPENPPWTALDGRARWLFHLESLVRFGFGQVPGLAVAGVVTGFFFDPVVVGFGALGLAFVAFVAAVWLPSLQFDRWAYAVGERELLIARGVVFRRITAIPTSRIQHVDLRQGPLERWLGLARIAVYTAAGGGADGVLPGLALADAEKLRDRLVRAEGDDGV